MTTRSRSKRGSAPKCKECGATQETAEFYDSIPGYCKTHWKERVNNNRKDNIEKYREADRRRSNLPHRVAARNAYAKTDKYKSSRSDCTKKSDQKYKDRKKARSALSNAIRDGLVQKQPCIACGESAEAHHVSYSLPLDVVWLCDKHHKQVHKEHREYMRSVATQDSPPLNSASNPKALPGAIFTPKGNHMKTFETFEQVADMTPCIKRPIVVHAKKMDEEFRVYPLEGNYKQGKPGDYLMCGIDGELYICDGEIFEKSYDFVQEG